ncbi:hypothetical protein DDF62_09570 [Caulobacter radicis]|uniref:hypothetical protein n=1 Tax=Caulobacter radicis TaxID=2172650 RepID=UPI000D56EA9C|nr:hypothetical protein [Caulobacter radicis]PVM90487.1 hypothetical protein DDF62_09570 [Caulobacter radicis]
MPDALDAPADHAFALVRRLHPVTRIVAAAGVVSLCGDVMQAIGIVSALQQGAAAQPMGTTIAGFLTSLGYTIGYVGAAATVEYLFRIWREVKAIRERG